MTYKCMILAIFATAVSVPKQVVVFILELCLFSIILDESKSDSETRLFGAGTKTIG